MAINKNHEFEDLDGIKCAIAEKNAGKARADFLKNLLESNGYTVVVVPTPPPKAAPAKPATTGEDAPAVPPVPETFTVGVTDVMFNPVNAIFGRLLKTTDGHVVTLAFWEQQESTAHDEIPYFEKRPGLL
ncbi:hypothetical protein I5907_14430 [Panacibacter sp. DH6]|uniref:Uncharacterized protein n=1 Tax=Panacibacter microcysteis TaxID=2793269 RepID=A0A931E2L6_9BACT|nr:hypothetical protein [Panacibacter microcysteis]MBG9377437.1 hypothetical protein [Panacibacter microcysteis]